MHHTPFRIYRRVATRCNEASQQIVEFIASCLVEMKFDTAAVEDTPAAIQQSA